MDSYMRYMLNSYLNEIKTRFHKEQHRLSQMPGYETRRLKITNSSNRHQYFSVFTPETGTYKYLGSEKNDEVIKIKEAHYLASSTKTLRCEIRAVEQFLKQSSCVTYEDINANLSKVYRDSLVTNSVSSSEKAATWKKEMEKYKASFPPFRPEELIHPTHDGSMVRSKSEALIYNYLLDMGVTFVYELPLRISYNSRRSLLLPDFTILSEMDFKSVIYIEHQGMMSVPAYRTKYNESVYKYWLNNYIPERDVFFTFDSPNGGFDDRPIRDIIFRRVRYERSQ